jgi:hypothetical protein
MSQNNPLVLVGSYQNIYYHASKSRVLKISSVFRMKNQQDTDIDNVFVLEKSWTKMYTIFSAVQRQRRKSDVMTSFGLTVCSAVYYHAGSSLALGGHVAELAVSSAWRKLWSRRQLPVYSFRGSIVLIHPVTPIPGAVNNAWRSW